MNGNPHRIEHAQRVTGKPGKQQRTGDAAPAAAGPGDYRSLGQIAPRCWFPYAHVILCQRKPSGAQGALRAAAIQPCRSDKSRRRTADCLFHHIARAQHPGQRLIMVKSQEFAFARRHSRRFPPRQGTAVAAVIAVPPAVDKHFNALIRPLPQLGHISLVLNQWRPIPMIGDHQHGKALGTQQRFQPVGQQIDLTFKTWADVVNRCQEPPGCAGRGQTGSTQIASVGIAAKVGKANIMVPNASCSVRLLDEAGGTGQVEERETAVMEVTAALNC